MTLLKHIYCTPFGWLIALGLHLVAPFSRPLMVFGYFNRPTRRFNKFTRISSTAALIHKRRLDLADHTFIWHYSIIDASAGVKIGTGCQIGAWVGIFTHGSHFSIRLLGADYFRSDEQDRPGWQAAPVEIGDYSFVGAHAVIMPGVTIGRGCLISAHAVVTASVPDYSVVGGNPARIVGDTRRLDRLYLGNGQGLDTYFDPQVAADFRRR